MALDKDIIKHIDRMDEIEAAIDKEITSLMKGLNMDEVIDDPEGIMLELTKILEESITQKYSELAMREGFKLAEVIKKHERRDEDIQVPKSKDPELNKELLGDTG